MKEVFWNKHKATNGKVVISTRITLSESLAILRGEYKNYNSCSTQLAERSLKFVINEKGDSWRNDIGANDVGCKDQLNQRMSGIYPAMTKAMRDVMIGAMGNSSSNVPRVEWEQASGWLINRRAYGAGEPLCYGNRVWEVDPMVGSHVVRINIGFGGNCNLDAKKIMESAIEGINAANALSAAGYMTEVHGLWLNRNRGWGGRNRGWGGESKEADLAAVAHDFTGTPTATVLACLASTMFFRTCGYPILDTQPASFSSGYGQMIGAQTCPMEPNERKAFEEAGILNDRDLYIPAETPADKVKQIIENFVSAREG